MPSAAFLAEMARRQGSNPRTKIEFIDKLNNVTDISEDFIEGANLETIKERAPDEIQAGQFDVVLDNADDRYSEYKAGSLLFELDYHGAKIRISQGFLLPSGVEEFEIQGVGFIDEISTDPEQSLATFRCRDLLWRIMDQKIHTRPPEEIPIPGSSNIGTGNISAISTRTFDTVNQTWTLTCTLTGGDGVATFSLIGSVSGSIGPVTSGTKFTDGTAGISFTIRAGLTPWQVGDIFTFETKQYPEWDSVNAGKIIWSVLTGFNWDTDTEEVWSGLVFDFDRTQSSANVDLDYDSFVDTIDNIDAVGVFDLKGFVGYDENAVQFFQDLLLLFVGSIFTGNDGRIKMTSFIPSFGAINQTFTDALKITNFGYRRTVDEIINSVSVEYKSSDNWEFSDGAVIFDGAHSESDAASIIKYKELGLSFKLRWFTPSGFHVQDFANKLISKFSAPPLNVDFITGTDALTTEIGDRVLITDTKYGLSAIPGEVARVSKQFDSTPAKVSMRVRRDGDTDTQFGFIGSEIDEGDGLSPQDEDFDAASDADKQFAYFGSVATSEPDYRIF